MKRLEGRIALVTGAASGIGYAIATAYAREGAHVVLNDLEVDALELAAQKLKDQGLDVSSSVADVCSLDQVRAMMAQVKADHGRLDILVNNAGITNRSDFRHMDDEKAGQVIDTNLNGIIRCTREAFELLKASGKANIINLSSVLGRNNVRQLSVYSATKGAVEALTRGQAQELATFGMRANYISPGFIETKMTDRWLRNPHMRKALLDKTPARRFGTPEDIAKAAVFLASDDAEFITGTGITVDGGVSVGIV